MDIAATKAFLASQHDVILDRLGWPLEKLLAERGPAPPPAPLRPVALEDELLELRDDLRELTARAAALAREARRLARGLAR